MNRLLWAAVGGVLFGFGLAFSGMARPEVVLSFLQLRDLGLLLVMAAALAVLVPVFQLAPRLRARTVLGEPFSTEVKPFHRGLIPGAVLFGLGWGLSGVCPGAAVASLGLGNGAILIALAGMLPGAWLFGRQSRAA
ncbi:DUF6691 family protein [Cyanobium sp. FACHB-13342]|uniref:DUF6691 family protein n=1 Tax=Cyanobium sp. FACHB-13342 TaxID=2692793 RepID=UPI00167FEC35|nr:DUF6691 family protein [Cyanobium sp. FACHB-13342]MBD2423975.1 YeeE/YedE family protein [Cyanobium sp. FACHB-13342]